MYDTLKRFEKKYAHLKKIGLRITGLGFADERKKVHVIEVTRPFLFDSRLIPRRFEGMDVRSKILGDLPQEFMINREREDWQKFDFVWAPERFEQFVDRCPQVIKDTLKNPDMTREDMLSALCFGNFEQHKLKIDKLIQEGKIPAYSQS
ncbi:MAG: hypothetical protein WCL14_12050 [Bacteroidota bacterium]